MQAILDCDDLMADKITEILSERFDEYEKKTDGLLSELKADFHKIDKKLAKIATSLEPQPHPWWLNYLIAPLIVLAIAATIGDIVYLHISVKGLQGYAHDNGGFIAGLRLQQSIQNPTNPAEAKQVLETAKAKKLKIDPAIVDEVGKKFVQAGTTSSDTWATAMAFVDYRSSLNTRPHFDVPETFLPPRTFTEVYDTTKNVLNPPQLRTSAINIENSSDAAHPSDQRSRS